MAGHLFKILTLHFVDKTLTEILEYLPCNLLMLELHHVIISI